TLHPRRGGLPEGEQALVVRVAVVGRVARRLAQAGHDVRRRRRVGVADAQVDQVGPARRDLTLQAVDLGEEVRRKLLDSLGFFDLDGQRRAFGAPLLADSSVFDKLRFSRVVERVIRGTPRPGRAPAPLTMRAGRATRSATLRAAPPGPKPARSGAVPPSHRPWAHRRPALAYSPCSAHCSCSPPRRPRPVRRRGTSAPSRAARARGPRSCSGNRRWASPSPFPGSTSPTPPVA